MRKISTLMVSVLCMMMPAGAEAQVPTAFVSKGATDIQAQPHTITQTNSGAQWAPIDPMVRSITMDDGLPSNAVRSVVQGSKGYMCLVQTTDCAVLTDTMSKPIIIPLRL